MHFLSLLTMCPDTYMGGIKAVLWKDKRMEWFLSDCYVPGYP
jgi:hypothetical protein